jgi:hypothetical protein
MGDDLTKSPPPLIIVLFCVVLMLPGVGVIPIQRPVRRRSMQMRVHVYLLEDGKMDALVEPSPGKGLSPVLVKGITRENVVDKVGPVVTEMRSPRREQGVLL